jgi:hypothetical protein
VPEAGRETTPWRTFRVPPSIDAALADLAISQHGVFDLDQLSAIGLARSGVRARKAAGRLHRIYHTVYSLVPPKLLTIKGHYMAAVLACGDDAALSHRSAAALLELRRTDQFRIDVTIPTRSPRKHKDLNIHRSTTLARADVTTVGRIPCTTVARTLLDLADQISRRSLERTFDQAEILNLLNVPAIEDQLRRNPKRRTAKVVRSILVEHYAGSTATWSELEERFLKLARESGLPSPEVNAWIMLDDGEPPIRADFVWRAQRVVVETDGHRTHRTRQAFERDRRNARRLTVAAWKPIRTTWRQLEREPHEIVRAVLTLVNGSL